MTGQRQSDAPDVLRPLAQYESELALSAKMNAVRWPPNYGKKYALRKGFTFETSIAHMQDFLEDRMAFMDSYLGNEENIE